MPWRIETTRSCATDERNEVVEPLRHAASSMSAPGSRHYAVAIPMDHCGRAADEITEIVREIGVVSREKRFVAVVRVVTDVISRRHEISKRVDTEDLRVRLRPDDVAKRLGHLGIVHHPPAVTDDLLRQRQARGHQERRPIDGVKANDFLPHQ